jgi:hypothetical protein
MTTETVNDLVSVSQVVLRSRFRNNTIGVGDIARVVAESRMLFRLPFDDETRAIENKAIIELAQRMIPTGTIPKVQS